MTLTCADADIFHFYDDDHSAFSDKPGSGFCTMQYHRTKARGYESADQALNCLCEPMGAWTVDDWLVDSLGKHWHRYWLGVMDDFGDLVEVDPDIGDDIPF